MSDRGLILAIQRIHEDPGFVNLVARDPQSTLGIYDLSDNERSAIIDACMGRDQAAMSRLAANVGMDWEAPHLPGLGTIPGDEETAGEVMDTVEDDHPETAV